MYPKCASNHSSSSLCCLLKRLRGIKQFARGTVGDIFSRSFQFQTAAHTHHNIKVSHADRCSFRIQMLLGLFFSEEPSVPVSCNSSHLASLSYTVSGCALLSILGLEFTEGGLHKGKGRLIIGRLLTQQRK